MGEMRNVYNILVGKPKGKDYSEYLGIDGRKILESILERQGESVWSGCIWLRAGTNSGLLLTE
jgi:hypothetical protein